MTPNIDLHERMRLIAARINEGRDSYAGRLDAWHRLGTVSGQFQTAEELLSAAKANFEVIKLQLEYRGQPVDGYGTFRIDQFPPKGLEDKAIPFQLKTGETYYLSFLAPVGSGYQVIQHTDGFELLDRLVGQIGGAHYETMGVLDFGRVVWAQVNPNFQIRVGEDVSDIYLSYITSHDSSRAHDIYETATRQVCRNTVKIGYLQKLAATLRIRHTRNAEKRVAALKMEIDEIKNVAMSMQERLTFLAGRRVQKESLTTIMNRLFPPTKNDDGVEESSTRRDNILAEILALYEFNDGNAFPEQRGTAYCLLNSLTNWVDHSRSSKGDGRAESAVFGSGDRLKTTALDLILAEAEGMPLMPVRGESVSVDWADLGLNIANTVN